MGNEERRRKAIAALATLPQQSPLRARNRQRAADNVAG
jgi:hypothetical protein